MTTVLSSKMALIEINGFNDTETVLCKSSHCLVVSLYVLVDLSALNESIFIISRSKHVTVNIRY